MKDISAIISFIIRLSSLILRLTIYDLLDDLFESYYVFCEDFYDKTQAKYLYFLVEALLLLQNNQLIDDLIEATHGGYGIDFYAMYVLPVKSLYLLLFYLAWELFKLFMGLYAAYIVLLEIYSGSLSYNEISYLKIRRRRGNFSLRMLNKLRNM